MGKSGFNYWIEIQTMKEKIDELMEEAYDIFDLSTKREEDIPFWRPTTDMYETESSYVIQMELSGMEKDEINIELTDKELIVSGERRFLKDINLTSYHIMERSYGPFQRRFVLPEDTDTSKISAKFKDGLLTIIIPKVKRVEKRIQITPE